MKKNNYLLLSAFLILVVLATGCAPATTPAPVTTQAPAPAATQAPAPTMAQQPTTTGALKGPITVGSKNFTEQYLLGWMTIYALQNAGFKVNNQTDLGGSSVVRDALTSGNIDMYWEYTGTAWLTDLGHKNAITDPQTAFDKVKAEDANNGLVWLQYAPFNDTYTLMMTKQEGAKYNIKSMSDLKSLIAQKPDAKVCVDQEFSVRPDGLPALQGKYGFSFKTSNIIPMQVGITYKALRDGQCDVAMGFATDGRIAAWGFFNLADNQQFFPVYNPAPVVRKSVLDKYPEIATIMAPIAAALDTATMTKLNALVDVGPDNELNTGDEETPQDVAKNFLIQKGLISGN